MVNFSLEGKVALVTGASYGIGFAIATAFAKAGATIVFNDIKQELVDKGLAAYEAEGIKAHGYVCDVTNEEQVNAFVAQVEKEVGIIDILVNNAGIIKRIPMVEMTAAEFRQVLKANRTPTDRRYYTYDQYLQFKGIHTENDNSKLLFYN